MVMLDLIVREGLAVTPSSAGWFDVGAAGGKIVAVGLPEAMQNLKAERVVDAGGNRAAGE